MKPYGREKKLQGTGAWKTDVHPSKGFMNWWENRCAFLTRGRMKQIIRKEINSEINGDQSNFKSILTYNL